jgi:pyruvate-formate lyase-activating enzyme
MSTKTSHPQTTPKPAEPNEALAVKEHAVHEERIWVRTTYACNNRCIFCLDGDVPPRGHRPKAEVEAEIRERFVPGARLIISGGEASIHPDFLDFVKLGRDLGYNWIQTITNGRMFAYKDFAQTATDNGLSEATFSMHGHTSALHDELTGIEGGFKYALRGMVNLLKTGRVVVNVDVVINGLNYRYLDDILDFYMRLGIHEFDLLQIVPFGRAWWPQFRDRMFYDIDEAFPYLNKAFKRASMPGVYIWTNRFPVAYLEDIEELIQDPHKLFDEMRGRRAEFDHFIESGEMLECYPERCRFCFLHDYCAGLVELRRRLHARDYRVLEIDLTAGDDAKPHGVLAQLIENTDLSGWRLHARDLDQARDWLRAAPPLRGEGALWLDRWSDLFTRSKSGRLPDSLDGVTTLVCGDPSVIADLARLDVALELLLTKDSANTLAALRESLIARGRVALRYPSVETLSEASALLPDPTDALAPWRDAPVPVFGVPLCLHPLARPEPPTLRLTSLDEQGLLDMPRYTRDYIRHEYRAHSNRCSDCVKREGCPGLHLNTLRVHRFRQLQPERVQAALKKAP